MTSETLPPSGRRRVAVLDDYPGFFATLPCRARLEQAGFDVVVFRDTVRGRALVERLDGFFAAVLTQQRTALPKDVVERLTSLRLLAQTGRSVAHIDVEACTRRGIAVRAAGTGDPRAPAELTMALIVDSARGVHRQARALEEGRWLQAPGRSLFGATLGVYGFGRIGSLVAELGRAFGMRVVCFGRSGSKALERARSAGFDVAADRRALFADSDVVTVHLPLHDETRGIVTLDDLRAMKPTALFVNTSRAALVAPGALAQALDEGRPGSCAVDVFEDEPLVAGKHPLVGRDNALCTPHLGYVEERTLAQYYEQAVDAVVQAAKS